MTARRPLDDRRKAIFLRVLAETGSVSAAAAAATPHSDGGKENRAGYRTFLDEMRRDPEFAEAVEEAKTAALGRVEEAISRRAMTPEKQPIFQRGELVGYRESYRDANQLLLRMAERLDPAAWASRKHISGEIQHHHAVAAVVLSPADILLLPENQREMFIAALELIAERTQKETKHDERPAAILPPAEAADGGHARQSEPDAAR